MVKLLKLVTGEDIIATVEDLGESFKVEKSAIIYPTGENNVGLAPFPMLASPTKVEINKSHIIYTVESEAIDPGLLNAYNQRFGSGLVLPGKNLKF